MRNTILQIGIILIFVFTCIKKLILNYKNIRIENGTIEHKINVIFSCLQFKNKACRKNIYKRFLSEKKIPIKSQVNAERLTPSQMKRQFHACDPTFNEVKSLVRDILRKVTLL